MVIVGVLWISIILNVLLNECSLKNKLLISDRNHIKTIFKTTIKKP